MNIRKIVETESERILGIRTFVLDLGNVGKSDHISNSLYYGRGQANRAAQTAKPSDASHGQMSNDRNSIPNCDAD